MYLWHCRLTHISKKRIEKLQQEGLLKSTYDESFDQCVSCLSSKMTRKSFPHRPERATDLLGIIHTDVCGPLRHVSRQGASYFFTFMDDYSRYGYVYLLKRKHKVFETFKVFKNEVENQLGKTIKALQSDRGGKYISQEFKDYLKACGIVQQLTPPYTPQHNGDYALESAIRNLNMVPTKKSQEVSGRDEELEEIQDKDTSPFENTSKIPMEVKDMQSMKDNQVSPNARLLAKGYTQTYGVDYEEKFSPVANLKAIRILIAIAAFYDYEIWQIDVKIIFINGYLDEDIYMV
ncbi:retrotransposon protein, putative, ty1-copia subclass [Tanacetum coccineum]